MAEYIVQIDHPELCVDYGGTNYADRLERIVRCKDCKHYVLDWEIDEERKCCTRLSKPLDEPLFPSDTGFCSWGEPKGIE